MARKGGKDRGVVEKPAGSGRWWIRLFSGGKEIWKRCDTKTQAKALYGKLKAQQREQRLFPKEKKRDPIILKEIAQAYEQALDADPDRLRKADDRAQIRYWIDQFGKRDIETITTSEIEDALNELRMPLPQRSGRLNKGECRSYETMRSYHGVLHAILEKGRKKLKEAKVQWMNPASDIEMKKADNTLVRHLTLDQEATLLAALPVRYHPIVLTAIHTGMRRGELLRLRWEECDWFAGMIRISKAKNGEPRYAAMNSLVQRTLLELKDSMRPKPSDRVFPFFPRYLSRAFKRAVNRAQLYPFRFHDLRHCFASRLAQLGANDRTLMEAGGWKSPAMLRRYVHLSPSSVWQAVEQLAQIGTGSKTGSGVNSENQPTSSGNTTV
jgi:integrase